MFYDLYGVGSVHFSAQMSVGHALWRALKRSLRTSYENLYGHMMAPHRTSMSRQFVLVTYDIPNDRRRTKLHKALKDFGTPVQYSVFECLVNAKELARMKRTVDRIIKPRLDSVRYYTLCRACQARIETTAASKEVAQEEDGWVV